MKHVTCTPQQEHQELPCCKHTFDSFDWCAALAGAMELVRDERSVMWFPAYGCALLAIGSPAFPGGPSVRRHLSVVGLDNWDLKPHWIHPPRCV